MSEARDRRGGGMFQVGPQVRAGGSLIATVEATGWGEPGYWGSPESSHGRLGGRKLRGLFCQVSGPPVLQHSLPSYAEDLVSWLII